MRQRPDEAQLRAGYMETARTQWGVVELTWDKTGPAVRYMGRVVRYRTLAAARAAYDRVAAGEPAGSSPAARSA